MMALKQVAIETIHFPNSLVYRAGSVRVDEPSKLPFFSDKGMLVDLALLFVSPLDDRTPNKRSSTRRFQLVVLPVQ